MPYYNKLHGVMSEIPWDKYSMELVTLQQFAEHRTVVNELYPSNCGRCLVAIFLEEALTNYTKGVQ